MMKKRSFDSVGETLFEGELENGLRVCVVPKPGFSACYAVFATEYGGAMRRFTLDGELRDTPAGVAHYLEHKMFDLPGGDNALNLMAASGADPNAFTANDMTAYYFQCTEHFEENLRQLLHFVSTPYFTDETVQKERGIITQEILMGEDDPGTALYYSLLRMLYERHPIREKVIGSVESISQITAETLYDCHRAFYAPSNMVLCVEGDVDPERVFEIAREELPAEKREKPQPDFGAEESLLPLERFKKESWPVSAPQFLFGAKLRPEKDGQALHRQRITAAIALRTLFGRSSPFYLRLYAEGLLNQDYDYEADFSAGTGTVILGGESREPERVLEEIRKAVAEVREKGLDAEGFERAKRASLGARLRGLEDFENVCLALASGVFEGYCPLEGVALLSEIKKSDCERFLTEALAPERLAAVIFENKGAGNDALDD